MSDKSTQELFCLLDTGPDRVLEPGVFDGLGPEAQLRRQRYKDLTQKYLGEHGSDFLKSEKLREPAKARYLQLERKVLFDYLQINPQYQELMELIRGAPGEVSRIDVLIEEIRNLVADYGVLPTERYGLSQIIRTKDEWQDSVQRVNKATVKIVREGWTPPEVRAYEVPEKPTVHIEKLCRWVRTKRVSDLLQHGICPSVCTGRDEIYPYIYAAPMRNDYWGDQLATERQHGRKSAEAYTQLEIIYDPSMEACMRMPMMNVGRDGNIFLAESGDFVSSQLVSLDRMVSTLAAIDEAQVENHRREFPKGENEWVYSPIVGREISTASVLYARRNHFNELILTGYVAPERIRVAG